MAIRKQIKQKDGSIPALDRYQIKTAIAKLPTLKEKALVAFLYLTGCRISEVLKYVRNKEQLGEPIFKKQIEVRPEVIIVYNVRVLKSRDIKTKKSIPIPRNNIEYFFVETFLEYYNELPEESPLWVHTRKWAYTTLAKVDLFPHLLRHSRVTSLVKDYNFSVPRLMQFIGWKDSNISMQYTHLSVADLLDFMQKANL